MTQRIFRTTDGYLLKRDGMTWTDNDMAFPAHAETGMPLDSEGRTLEGRMLVAPTIHLNGTDAMSLYNDYDAAAQAVREALRKLTQAAPNARDYYPQGDRAFQAAVVEHEKRWEKLESVAKDLAILMHHVVREAR